MPAWPTCPQTTLPGISEYFALPYLRKFAPWPPCLLSSLAIFRITLLFDGEEVVMEAVRRLSAVQAEEQLVAEKGTL